MGEELPVFFDMNDRLVLVNGDFQLYRVSNGKDSCH
jgi:hypothetical protein